MPKKIRSKLSFPEAVKLWEKHQLNPYNPSYWGVHFFFWPKYPLVKGVWKIDLIGASIFSLIFFPVAYLYFFVERFEKGSLAISVLGLLSAYFTLRVYREYRWEKSKYAAIQAAEAAQEEERRQNNHQERKRKMKRKKHNRPKGYK